MLPVARLAPSPNGHLHLGHARSFLLAWWTARAAGGRVVLRIDDLDPSRCRREYEEGVLRDLEWLGLDWDGVPVRQSERTEAHRAAARRLIDEAGAYPCVCTRAEILLAAPHRGEEPAAYPGTCRGRYASLDQAAAASGRAPLLRFPAPEGPVAIEDQIHGALELDLQRDAGDFPILTRESLATYQLATVLDDADAGVTQVLRGDDLLSSAFRQAALQDQLGLPRPDWIHVPLVVEEGGHRLAKRSADRPLHALREAGLDPRVLVAWAGRSAGQAAPEPLHAAELVPHFDLARLPLDPAVLDQAARTTLGLKPSGS